MISIAVCANDLYSALVEEQAIVGYFLALQLMRLEPKNTQEPLADLPSKVQPTQSALEYADMWSRLLLNQIP